jgi:UDP-glucose 4-epimerase
MITQSEIALVTGATGAIGQVLVRKLLGQGYQLRVLVRHTLPLNGLPESVGVFQGDITDSHVLNAAATGADVIFHLAAKLHVNNPTPPLHEEYKRVNVEGTRRLVEAAQRAQVRRLILFSTINVYGPSQPGQILSENFPLHPDSWYAETKAQGEQIVLSGLPAVVLRLAAVYGPGMKGNYARLVRALARGLFVPVGNCSNRRTLVHVQDVVTAALLAAQHPAAAGQIYNVTDGHVHTLNEIIAAICQALGRRPPYLYIPVTMARLPAGLVEDALRIAGRQSPLGRFTIDKFIEDVAVHGDRIQTELGFRPAYDLEAGWQETIAELRRNGEL